MDKLVEAVARAIYFDHVDQHGYPNGLMTWDELPEVGTLVATDKDHWRSIAQAAIAATFAHIREQAGRDDVIEAGVKSVQHYSLEAELAQRVFTAMLNQIEGAPHD
jgi:hypothetical protein